MVHQSASTGQGLAGTKLLDGPPRAINSLCAYFQDPPGNVINKYYRHMDSRDWRQDPPVRDGAFR